MEIIHIIYQTNVHGPCVVLQMVILIPSAVPSCWSIIFNTCHKKVKECWGSCGMSFKEPNLEMAHVMSIPVQLLRTQSCDSDLQGVTGIVVELSTKEKRKWDCLYLRCYYLYAKVHKTFIRHFIPRITSLHIAWNSVLLRNSKSLTKKQNEAKITPPLLEKETQQIENQHRKFVITSICLRTIVCL